MNLILRHAIQEDCHDLWVWRNHPEVRKWAFSRAEIDLEAHKEWFSRKIIDDQVRIYIAEEQSGRKLAQVRFEVGVDGCCVHVNLNPVFFGQGWGNHVIRRATERFFIERLDVAQVMAKVVKGNIASEKAFQKAGYLFLREARDEDGSVMLFVHNR